MILNKLAAGITAIAIATTAVSIPANAKNKDRTTLLAILAGGLVINELVDKKKGRKQATVTQARHDYKPPRDKRITHQHRNGQWYTHDNMAELRSYHNRDRRRDKGRDWDRDRTTRDYRFDRRPDHVIPRPIQDRISKLPIPKKCHRTKHGRFGQAKHGVSRKCLRKRGYRINNHGVVSHHKWPGLRSRPNLL